MAFDIGEMPSKIIGTVLGIVVGLAIIAAVVGLVFSSVAGVGEAYNDPNTTTGDDTADSLLPIFPLIFGVTILLGFSTLIIGFMQFKKLE